MSYGWVALVIFVTFLAGFGWGSWVGAWASRPRVPLARLADPAPLPGELPHAGYFDLPGTLARFTPYEDEMQRFAAPATRLAYCRKDMHLRHPIGECPYDPPEHRFAAPDGPYGPFPVDTGPLLILSEQAAANVALEREIEQQCAEAEAKIPPRWR